MASAARGFVFTGCKDTFSNAVYQDWRKTPFYAMAYGWDVAQVLEL